MGPLSRPCAWLRHEIVSLVLWRHCSLTSISLLAPFISIWLTRLARSRAESGEGGLAGKVNLAQAL